MRDLQSEYRLVARSLPEVHGSMLRLLLHFGESRKVRWKGRKLSQEAFLNAAVIHLVELPEDEQFKILAGAVGKLTKMLESEEPLPLGTFTRWDAGQELTEGTSERIRRSGGKGPGKRSGDKPNHSLGERSTPPQREQKDRPRRS